MRDRMKRTVALLLSVLLLGGLLSGCGKTEEAEEVQDDHIDVNATLSGQTLTAGAAVDDVFSLPVEYNKKLNPITTTSSLNQMACGLVYDQLFQVDDNYNLSSRILDDWYFSETALWCWSCETTSPCTTAPCSPPRMWPTPSPVCSPRA